MINNHEYAEMHKRIEDMLKPYGDISDKEKARICFKNKGLDHLKKALSSNCNSYATIIGSGDYGFLTREEIISLVGELEPNQ